MTWKHRSDQAGWQAINETSTEQKHAIGERAIAFDETYGYGEFIYAKGVGSTAEGDLCLINTYAPSTTRVVAGSRGPVGIAQSANIANQFGWYQIFGAGAIKAGTVAANANVYATATPGTIDDAVVAGDKVDGARLKTADGTPAAGKAVVQLAYPSMNANG